MGDQVAILPLAIAMVAGPQIVAAVVLATSRRPQRNSLAYIAGVTCATLAALGIAYGAAHLFGEAADAAGASDSSDWLRYVVVALLAALAIRTFLTRKTAKPPKWMTSLQEAEPKNAFKVGFLLFLLMPSDVIVVLGVGGYLVDNGLGYLDGLPFVGLTLLLISLPYIAYRLLGARAETALPRVREWMNANSWVITIAVLAYFIYAFLS